MRTRPMEYRDTDAVKAIAGAAGYGFRWPEFGDDQVVAWDVVVDDNDTVIMAAAGVRTVELFLACSPGGATHPFVKMEAMRLLHESLRDKLVPKGYSECFAFLPPEIEKSHGRHLKKIFGWLKAWPAYVIRDWKSVGKAG